MANSKTSFKQGINLNPTDDPTTQNEGDIYFSDGTTRETGLWQFESGDWKKVGSANSIPINKVGHGFTLFQGVSVQAGGTVIAATNTTEISLRTHIVVEVVDVDNIKIQASGSLSVPTAPLTVGETYWADATGLPTLTKPTVAGEFLTPLFHVSALNYLELLCTSQEIEIVATLDNDSSHYRGTRSLGNVNLPNTTAVHITPDSDVDNADGISDGLGNLRITKDGVYLCTASFVLNPSTAFNGTNEQLQLQLQILDTDNSTVLTTAVIGRLSPTTSDTPYIAGSMPIRLLEDQYVRYLVFHGSGITESVDASSTNNQITITRIG